MTTRRQLVLNAGAATLQVVVSGLLMFGLYRYLIAAIGVESLGIWSVVLATTSASRITELGLTGSVVRFVARYLAVDDHRNAGDVVETAVLSLAVFVGVVLLVAYFPCVWVLQRVLPAGAVSQGRALLPYALGSLWVTTLSGVFLSALDGCQRTDIRALFNTGTSVLTLAFALALVPGHGLLGLAYGQMGIAVLSLVTSWIWLKRELVSLSVIPVRWKRASFREMIGYGANFQVISFVAISFDPVTKSLLSRFGGLAAVGYYEMASRMLFQIRSVLTAPNQVLVPVIAGLQERDPGRIRVVYQDSYRLQAYLALPLYAGIVATVPAVSRLWVGSYQPQFVANALLLTLGWFLNGFINPAYFSNLGSGKLKWNTISHVTIGVLNVVLGLLMGYAFGGMGVVAGWVVALAVGSSVVLVTFHLDNHIPLAEMFPRENLALLLCCLFGIAAAWLTYRQVQYDSGIFRILTLCPLAFGLAVALPLWRHPMRVRLLGMMRRNG